MNNNKHVLSLWWWQWQWGVSYTPEETETILVLEVGCCWTQTQRYETGIGTGEWEDFTESVRECPESLGEASGRGTKVPGEVVIYASETREKGILPGERRNVRSTAATGHVGKVPSTQEGPWQVPDLGGSTHHRHQPAQLNSPAGGPD